jgi:hypothetical protein
MATIARTPTPVKHYASYLVNGEEVYGVAQLVNGTGYLFTQDGQRTARLVSYTDPELILGGLVDDAPPADPRPLWQQIADPGYYEGRARHGDLVRGR